MCSNFDNFSGLIRGFRGALIIKHKRMTESEKSEKPGITSDEKKPFDTGCKGPKIGKSFYFVPLPEIRVDASHEKVDDINTTLYSFPSIA